MSLFGPYCRDVQCHARAEGFSSVVRGKQVHDCNIVATMLTNGVRRLATRNATDFRRYAGSFKLMMSATDSEN